LSPGEPRHGRRLDAAVARLRGADRRHLRLLPARLDRRLPRRLGPCARARARQPLPALLARRAGASAEASVRMSRLSHVGGDGRATMVDVSDKAETRRVTTAEGVLRCAAATLALVRAGRTPKGAVVQTAELAGIMAAKRTAELIPLCHPLPLARGAVEVESDDPLPGLRVPAGARAPAATGCPEALPAVSIACLTLFDMLKAVDRTMTIEGVRVTAKRGGKSGDWAASGGAA